ncbi:hypothetical protein T310_9023, partial [Rasamsonia emersonii CBS 393.64]
WYEIFFFKCKVMRFYPSIITFTTGTPFSSTPFPARAKALSPCPSSASFTRCVTTFSSTRLKVSLVRRLMAAGYACPSYRNTPTRSTSRRAAAPRGSVCTGVPMPICTRTPPGAEA